MGRRPFWRAPLAASGACAFLLSASAIVLGLAPAGVASPPTTLQDTIPDLLLGAATGAGGAWLVSGGDLAGPPDGPWGAAFTSGVRVAAGDLNADSIADLILASGPGIAGLVTIYDGLDGREWRSGHPFGPSYLGGLHVAAGDVNGDGRSDLIVAMGAGPRVRVYDAAAAALITEGDPYGPGFTGGVHVAAGDVDGDGQSEIVTAPATGAGPVRVFRADRTLVGEVAPYGAAFGGGVHVAVGDVDGDGYGDLITSPASGAQPIHVYSARTRARLHSFSPAGLDYDGGYNVAAGDFTADGRDDIVVALGPGHAPWFGVFDGATAALHAAVLAGPADFRGGVVVAAAPAASAITFTSPNAATFVAGAEHSFVLATAATPPVSRITIAGALPSGLAFTDHGDGTATLGGTPAPGTGGVHALSFTAGRAAGVSVTQSFTLTVNEPAMITSGSGTAFRVGAARQFTVTTSGWPVPSLTIAGAVPAGVTFVDHGDGTATLTGTPAAGTGGLHALTVAATSIAGGATQAFTLAVEESAAITSGSDVIFPRNAPAAFTVTAAGFPPPALGITGTLPMGITLTDHGNGTATLGGTPAADATGVYALTVTAGNGIGTEVTQALTLSVTPTDVPVDDADFRIGRTPAMAIGADGLPIISHHADTIGALRVTHCGNAACTAGNVSTTVDDEPNHVGAEPSIAIGHDGLPIIAHLDLTASTLRVTKCGTVACTAGNVSTTVDAPGFRVGIGSSIAIGPGGLPVISHTELNATVTASALRVTRCGNPACTSGNVSTTVDAPGGFAGVGSRIAIGADGLPVISHENVTAGVLRVTKCGTPDCASGNASTDLVNRGVFSSLNSTMAIGADGLPVLAYHDGSALFALWLIKCGNHACTAGNVSSMVEAPRSGSIEIAAGANGLPVLVDFGAGGVRVTTCGDAACGAGNVSTTIASTVNVVAVADPTLRVGADGLPLVIYQIFNRGVLRAAKCATPTCQ
jgi:hypothetical protein